jgi:DNA-binding transcriptional ArsR family regulator
MSVSEIAGTMTISRPAVSQHLALLKEAGLVKDQPVGTRRVYYIDPRGLSAVRAWFDQFWDHALASFQAEVARRVQRDEKNS